MSRVSVSLAIEPPVGKPRKESLLYQSDPAVSLQPIGLTAQIQTQTQILQLHALSLVASEVGVVAQRLAREFTGRMHPSSNEEQQRLKMGDRKIHFSEVRINPEVVDLDRHRGLPVNHRQGIRHQT